MFQLARKLREAILVSSPAASVTTIAAPWLYESLLFLGLCIIYLGNRISIWAGDTVPSSLFVANIIQNGTIFFDAAKAHNYFPIDAFFFSQTTGGHISSTYPIMPQLIFAPLNFVYYIFSSDCRHATVFTGGFETCRLASDKFSSSILAAIAALLFYRVARKLITRRSIAWATTLFFAIGSNQFMISSQSNWQHGPTVFICVLAMNLMLSDRLLSLQIFGGSRFDTKPLLLFLLLGALISIRPTNALWAGPFLLWFWFQSRRQNIWVSGISLLIGFGVGLIGIIWNYILFGNLVGGYVKLWYPHLFEFSLSRFVIGAYGQLLGPSRGLILITPVTLISFLGGPTLFRKEIDRRYHLLAAWFLSGVGICVAYFFYLIWWSGWSFGPRFLTDTMPVMLLTAGVIVEKSRKKLLYAIFIIFGVVGIANQLASAYGASGLYGVQFDSLNYSDPTSAYLNWNDIALERSYLSVFNKLAHRGVFFAERQETGEAAACILPTSNNAKTVAVANNGGGPWIGFLGGSPVPPTLEISDSEGPTRIFQLRDRYVSKGSIGTFVSLKGEEVGTVRKVVVKWNGEQVALKCR